MVLIEVQKIFDRVVAPARLGDCSQGLTQTIVGGGTSRVFCVPLPAGLEILLLRVGVWVEAAP